MYDLIDAFAKGYSHINDKTSRGEDFGATYKSDLCQIFAVADGHGDSNCPRSAFGSETACRVAISNLKTFYEAVVNSSLVPEILESGNDFKRRMKHLITSIVSDWNLAVRTEYEGNPLNAEERAGCDEYLELYDKGEEIGHIYGTTLIAGLMTDKYLLLLQQGDGRCDVFDGNGKVSQPIPWDERCIGNITTSICQSDAIQRFRYCVIDIVKNPISACIADTDGAEDSFGSMGLLHNFHRDILIYACENGITSLHDHLKEILPELSKERSRDDITICGFVDLQKVTKLILTFRQANEIVNLESKLSDIDARLKSMQSMGKMEALKVLYKKACEEVEKAKQIPHESDSPVRLEDVLADKEKKEKEYQAYKKRKTQLEEERGIVIQELHILTECSANAGSLLDDANNSVLTEFTGHKGAIINIPDGEDVGDGFEKLVKMIRSSRVRE